MEHAIHVHVDSIAVTVIPLCLRFLLFISANAVNTFTWTDNKAHMLMVACVGGKTKSWSLYSTSNKVDEATRKLVLESVTKLGFDTSKMFSYSYEKCPA